MEQTAVGNKFPRISFEVSERNEAAIQLFNKLGATNLTGEEGWLNYSFSPEATVQILQSVPEPVPDEIIIRRTEPRDCASIVAFIKELATFEKMPDGPKLSVTGMHVVQTIYFFLMTKVFSVSKLNSNSFHILYRFTKRWILQTFPPIPVQRC